MKKQLTHKKRGFSLIELLVSMSLGLIVMAAITQLFKTGVQTSFVVSQRAEMQENLRAGIDLVEKDLTMAGAGLPSGGIQLPAGAGSSASKYGCDQVTCYVATNLYPNGNYMYGVIPGPNNGVQGGGLIPATGKSADSITVAYVDYNFPLFQYQVTFPAGGPTGTSVNVAVPTPAPVPALPAINGPGGLQVGDLVMLSNNIGTAVGEVTGVNAGAIAFANLDALNFNQDGAAENNIKSIYIAPANPLSSTPPTTAYRLFVVTYYLQVPVNGQTPRLMRQVNGLTPAPVADNIVALDMTYDMYNTTTATEIANVHDPSTVAGVTPNSAGKMNVALTALSITQDGKQSQSMYVATSVSARNMSFKQRY